MDKIYKEKPLRDRSWRRFQSKKRELYVFKKLKATMYVFSNEVGIQLDGKFISKNDFILMRAKRVKENMKTCSCFLCKVSGIPKLKDLKKSCDNLEINDSFIEINQKK